jgi:mannose-P-dolichol utilization defect protein 1
MAPDNKSVLRAALRVAAFACLAVLLLGQLPLVSAASGSAAAPGEFEWVVFPKGCIAQFLSFDLFTGTCLKATISKLLGVAIIAGACVVSLPQIIACVRAGSASVSLTAAYLEVVGYIVQSAYHVVGGSPFSAYGETLIVGAQSALMVLLIWRYAFPGGVHVAVASAAAAALTQAAIVMAGREDMRGHLQTAVTLLFIGARGAQILANVRAGSTGDLAFLSLFMKFAGAAARVFTSSVELKGDKAVFYSFVVSAALNGVLVAQYLYYRLAAGGAKAAAAAAAAVEPKSDKAPKSGPKSGSKASKKD